MGPLRPLAALDRTRVVSAMESDAAWGQPSTRVGVKRLFGRLLRLPQQLLHREADILGYFPEERRRDIASLVEGNRCAPAIGVPQLLVRRVGSLPTTQP